MDCDHQSANRLRSRATSRRAAARQARYGEVRYLLDEAENTGKVYHSKAPAQFTASLSPDSAANIRINLINPDNIVLLTPATRADFFMLLSVLGEDKFV